MASPGQRRKTKSFATSQTFVQLLLAIGYSVDEGRNRALIPAATVKEATVDGAQHRRRQQWQHANNVSTTNAASSSSIAPTNRPSDAKYQSEWHGRDAYAHNTYVSCSCTHIHSHYTYHLRTAGTVGKYCLCVLLMFNDTYTTNRLYRVIGVWNVLYCVGPGENT